jgi:cell division protein FtsQ
MARKNSGGSEPRSWLSILRYWVRIVIAGGVLVGALYGYHRVEQFLVRDPRFTFITPDYGLLSPSLRLEGIKYASRTQVLRVFSADFGRSIYLMPLAARRLQLCALDWVRDASISRIWPNRIIVKIREREPVAYLQLPADRFARVALIDADGVILQQPPRTRFALPVVLGIRASEPEDQRKEKIHRLGFLMKQVGPLGDHLSEIDVSDRDNLKVTAKAGNRGATLILGDQNFRTRLQNFLDHYPDIQRRLPDAAAFDLRLDDRITVVEDNNR